MKGHIHIDVVGNGRIQVDVMLSKVGLEEKVQLMSAFLDGMHINKDEAEFILFMRELIKDSTEKIEVDMSKLRKFPEDELPLDDYGR